MALHRPPDIRLSVPRADRDHDVGRPQAGRLHLPAHPHQRRSQVAVDVVRQRFQRRHIKDATALSLGWRGLGGQSVEAPEKGSEGLPAAGRGGHERVLAGGDLAPALLLHVGGSGERGAKPVPSRGREQIQRAPHASSLNSSKSTNNCSP